MKVFLSYLKDVKSLTALLGKGAILAPSILALASTFLPPDPNKMAVVFGTTILELLILVFVFSKYDKKRTKVSLKKLNIYLLLSIIAFLSYFIFYVIVVHKTSIPEQVIGFIFKKEALYWHNKGFSIDQILEMAGGNRYEVWERYSINKNIIILNFFWFGFFSLFSNYLSLFTIKNKTNA